MHPSRRRPALQVSDVRHKMKRVILFVAGSGGVVWAVAAWFTGNYHTGRGSSRHLVTEANDPWAYWGGILIAVCVGVSLIVAAIKKVAPNEPILREE